MSLSTLANATPKSELEALGVQLYDPVEKFWRVFGERMKVHLPEAPACASAISKEISQYGIITVGGMAELEMHEMQECIVDGGGSKKWAKSVQRLLGTNFKESSAPVVMSSTTSQPPASAALVKTDFKSAGAPRFPNCKLGERLTQHGIINQCVVSEKKLLAVVRETKNPKLEQLTYNDTKAVMNIFFEEIFTMYGNVGSCKVLFEHLVKQAEACQGGLFAAPHGKCSWLQVSPTDSNRRALVLWRPLLV
jgi:hypothetical protein